MKAMAQGQFCQECCQDYASQDPSEKGQAVPPHCSTPQQTLQLEQLIHYLYSSTILMQCFPLSLDLSFR